MKKGKLILSTAAVIYTVAGAFAMKSTHKITGHATCYTKASGCVRHSGCHTIGAATRNKACSLTGTIYTSHTVLALLMKLPIVHLQNNRHSKTQRWCAITC